jgi:hypothetical protein
MRWLLRSMMLATFLALVGVALAAPQGTGPRVKTVTLVIHHRVFPDFIDRRSVALRQEFQVGDTPFSARIVEFVPDFSLDLKSHQVRSRSREPRNPAFRLVVKEKGVPRDTTWAFLNTMPPHFARRSLLAFQVARIEFEDHAALESADTLLRQPR